MLDLVIQWLPLGISLIALILLFVLLGRERKARLALEAKFSAMELVAKNARQQHESLTKQFNELRVGTMGMSQKMAEIADHQEMLADRQSEISMQDPDGRLYSRANKMVELGADINELMEECDLPKAEAELLMRLQQISQTRRR
ncbi:DUF2802 domain-containing protein [Photobacterium sanguinicancri]|uniref:DNA repair protein n=1 Tax=Photobacterium sanguinicancri TaxID=875932 RepID=A0ABX4G554_9GAMM|nr:DUF2802 domain-containing protein [Photobacterium sanguinicancri]MDO6497545.1 DUF2802 domain-containing protein [Photobacterium sanguinicancri]OZS45680.1 DNA repair protein [Photobacterium sanguinicancri]